MAVKEMWNDRYAIEEYVYGTEPNTFFKSFIDGLEPGTLLLPGEGEGRNAVYAACLGWTVHAIDFSIEGRKKAMQLAENHQVTIWYDIMDILDFQPGARKYDLIGIIFLHLDPSVRGRLHRILSSCLNPGGYLIMEAFEKKQIEHQTGGPKNVDYLYRLEDIISEFSVLQTIESKEETIILDSNLVHQGEGRVIRYIGQNIKSKV